MPRTGYTSSRRNGRAEDRIQYGEVEPLFHLTIREAAGRLSVWYVQSIQANNARSEPHTLTYLTRLSHLIFSETVLKRACRRLGVPHWPGRSIRKLTSKESLPLAEAHWMMSFE